MPYILKTGVNQFSSSYNLYLLPHSFSLVLPSKQGRKIYASCPPRTIDTLIVSATSKPE